MHKSEALRLKSELAKLQDLYSELKTENDVSFASLGFNIASSCHIIGLAQYFGVQSKVHVGDNQLPCMSHCENCIRFINCALSAN